MTLGLKLVLMSYSYWKDLIVLFTGIHSDENRAITD